MSLKKNILLVFNTLLLAALNAYASENDRRDRDNNWSMEEIRQVLILSEREADLGLFDDLIQQKVPANQIAVLLEIDASTPHKVESGLTTKPDYDADHLMAQLLDAELNGQRLTNDIKGTQNIPQLKIKREIITTLRQVEEESQKYHMGDVHVYNKGIVIKYRDFCQKLCDALNLKRNIPIDRLISRISEHNSTSLNQSIIKLNAHQLNVIDAETGLKIDDMLSYITDICDKLYSLPHKQNAYVYMAESLAENIDTQGGCKPGYAGRFFRDLLRLSLIYLEKGSIEFIE